MTTYGYCRISRDTQEASNQEAHLRSLGAEIIITETKSGRDDSRPLFNELLNETLTEGDTLIVRHIDRMGRTLKKLLTTRETLQTKGVKLIANGRTYNWEQDWLIYVIEGAMAEQEVRLNSQRVSAAHKARASQGKPRLPGRPKAISPRQQIEVWKARQGEDPISITTLAAKYGVARATVRKAIELEDTKRTARTQPTE